MAGVVATRLLVAMAILAAELLVIAVLGTLFIEPSCGFLKWHSSSSSSRIIGRSSIAASSSNSSECAAGRRIFVYDLPPQFNAELARSCHSLNPWASMCSALSNSGLGPPISSRAEEERSWWDWLWRKLKLEAAAPTEEEWPAWYATDQFSCEVIFHQRMLQNPCRTRNPEEAMAFFVPIYTGLDVSRHLWTRSSSQELDRLGLELLEWLKDQRYFRRRGGTDHFLVAGRITWDFRRMPASEYDWGSSLFHRLEMRNVTRLVIERNPWDDADVGVPYPTSFHPRSDEELELWRHHVAARNRSSLFAFAGSPRPDYRTDFRGLLLDQCRSSASCSWLACEAEAGGAGRGAGGGGGCTSDPLRVTKLFLDSVFCLQPRGDSFTRRSIFDSMISGCIPVFFWNQSAYWQYQLYLPPDPSSYSVFIRHEDVRNGTRIAEVLAAIPESSVHSMQRVVLSIMPGLLYASSSPRGSVRHWKDAFDVAIDGVLDRIESRVRE